MQSFRTMKAFKNPDSATLKMMIMNQFIDLKCIYLQNKRSVIEKTKSETVYAAF